MNKLYEQYMNILEKFSNYKGILDDVLHQSRMILLSLDGQKVTEIGTYENGYMRKFPININGRKFPISFVPRSSSSYFDPKKQSITVGLIQFTTTMDGRPTEIDSSFKTKKQLIKYLDSLKININNENLSKILSIIAHEITHYSQGKNKFADYDLKKNKERFDNEHPFVKAVHGNNEYAYLGGAGHSKSQAEHEARLVEFFNLIKSKNYKEALSIFGKDGKYFENFKFKDVANKMYDYGIRYDREYKEFQDYVDDYLINVFENNDKKTFILHNRGLLTKGLYLYKRYRIGLKALREIIDYYYKHHAEIQNEYRNEEFWEQFERGISLIDR